MDNSNQNEPSRNENPDNSKPSIFWCLCGVEKEVRSPKYVPGARYNFKCPICIRKDRLKQFQQLVKLQSLYLDTDTEKLPAQFKDVMSWQYGPQGLILMGDSGTGKTRCAWQLIRRVMVDDQPNQTVKFFDGVAFGYESARQARSETLEDWLDEIAQAGLVFMDDFGKFKMTERVEVDLFGMLDRRFSNKLPVILTTNDTSESFYARLSDHRGPAMIRRLREFCNVIQF